MRRVITLMAFLSFCVARFASENSLVVPPKKASAILVPVGKTGKQVSLVELSHMKVREYEAMSGQKLNLASKLGFKLAQRQLKRAINPDGSFKQKRLEA